LGLPVSPETPLIGFVSRVTEQKMADVISQALPWITERKAQFALVGEGDPALEMVFADAQAGDPTICPSQSVMTSPWPTGFRPGATCFWHPRDSNPAG